MYEYEIHSFYLKNSACMRKNKMLSQLLILQFYSKLSKHRAGKLFALKAMKSIQMICKKIVVNSETNKNMNMKEHGHGEHGHEEHGYRY
jgi:hypothetical protein